MEDQGSFVVCAVKTCKEESSWHPRELAICITGRSHGWKAAGLGEYNNDKMGTQSILLIKRWW